MLGSNSEYGCLDTSHKVESDGELRDEGSFAYPDAVVKDYSEEDKKDIRMEEGGV